MAYRVSARSSTAFTPPTLNRAAGLLAAAAAVAFVAPRTLAQFVNNDLYLISAATPGAGGTCNHSGLIRINPTNWQATLVADFTPVSLLGRGAYDPARDRIVVVTTDSHLELISSTGVITQLPYFGLNNLLLAAPQGDGRIYTWGFDQMRYLDSANAAHPLMNQTGSAPFVLAGTMKAMIYDPGTNALFLGTFDAVADLTQVIKVPLNAAGTAVQGQTSMASFDASVGNNSEQPVGFSRGPAGTLFLKIDDNSGQTAARMLLINPTNLQITPYAYSGYFGVGGETAGAYDAQFDRALVLDTLAVALRSFAQSQSGGGDPITLTDVPLTCAGGESAQLLVIQRSATVCYANCDASTVPPVLNVNDFICFQTRFAAGNSYANCDGSTVPPVLNVNDFICFQTHFASGCP